MEKKSAIAALGGNVLDNSLKEQIQAVANTAGVIVGPVQEGMDIAVTRGNGLQAGMIQSAMDRMTAEESTGAGAAAVHFSGSGAGGQALITRLGKAMEGSCRKTATVIQC